MFPMLIRAAQIILVIFGAVLLLAAVMGFASPPDMHATFLHISALFLALFQLALAFAAFLAAFRIGKWREKIKDSRVPPTY